MQMRSDHLLSSNLTHLDNTVELIPQKVVNSREILGLRGTFKGFQKMQKIKSCALILLKQQLIQFFYHNCRYDQMTSDKKIFNSFLLQRVPFYNNISIFLLLRAKIKSYSFKSKPRNYTFLRLIVSLCINFKISSFKYVLHYEREQSY